MLDSGLLVFWKLALGSRRHPGLQGRIVIVQKGEKAFADFNKGYPAQDQTLRKDTTRHITYTTSTNKDVLAELFEGRGSGEGSSQASETSTCYAESALYVDDGGEGEGRS